MNDHEDRPFPLHRDDIIVVSTRTTDHVSRDGRVSSIPGGPATYIGAALDHLGSSWRLITGEHVDVEAHSTERGEEYTIPPLRPIPLPTTLRAGAVVLSPVMQEIDARTPPEVEGLLVVDLQGFVRRPLVPSLHTEESFYVAPLLSQADLVKAGEAELERLDHPSREALWDVLLLTTRGAGGASLRRGSWTYEVPVRAVQAAHTIGAGDTFLAALVHALVHGERPSTAAVFAADFTSRILEDRRADLAT